MPESWDREGHPAKEYLSLKEKNSMLSHEGWHLIFPGAPDSNDSFPEFEELVASGSDGAYVIGLEKVGDNALKIWEKARRRFQVEHEAASSFFRTNILQFNYIHLDFCTPLKSDEIEEIESTKGHLAPVARLRISWSWGRDDAGIEERHQTPFLDKKLIPFIKLAQNNDSFPERWDVLLKAFENPTSSIPIVGFLIMWNQFFGLESSEIQDCLKVRAFPAIEGTHTIHNVNFETYQDTKLPMHTLWVDCIAFDPDSVEDHMQFALDSMYHYLIKLTTYKDRLCLT